MTQKSKSTIYHNKIAEDYESLYYSEPFWQLYFEVTWSNLKKYLLQTRRAIILDAGGGTGYQSRKLAKLGYSIICSIICTDVAQKMLDVGMKLAKQEKLENRIEFKNVNIINIACFKDNSFDLVIAQDDPVGYCKNPPKAIGELSRVAKKGTYVNVSIDGFYSTLCYLLRNKNFKPLEKLLRTHISEFHGGFSQYNFTVDELKEMFESNGLKVVDIIGKPVFAGRILRTKLNELLSDRQFFKKILELENNFNNDLSIIGLSGHIQITGKKT